MSVDARVWGVVLLGLVLVLYLALPFFGLSGKSRKRRSGAGVLRENGATGQAPDRGHGAGAGGRTGGDDVDDEDMDDSRDDVDPVIDRVEFADRALLSQEAPEKGLRSLSLELAQLDARSGIFGVFRAVLGLPLRRVGGRDVVAKATEGYLLEVFCHPQGFKRGSGISALVDSDFADEWASLVKKSGIDRELNGMNRVGEDKPDAISKFSLECRYFQGFKISTSHRGASAPKEAAELGYDLARSLIRLLDDPAHPMSRALRSTFRDL